MKSKLPALIKNTKARRPIKRLPIGKGQKMLDSERANYVSRLQQRIANLEKKIFLAQTVDNALINATFVVDLEMELEIAKLELFDLLATYSANGEASNG